MLSFPDPTEQLSLEEEEEKEISFIIGQNVQGFICQARKKGGKVFGTDDFSSSWQKYVILGAMKE